MLRLITSVRIQGELEDTRLSMKAYRGLTPKICSSSSSTSPLLVDFVITLRTFPLPFVWYSIWAWYSPLSMVPEVVMESAPCNSSESRTYSARTRRHLLKEALLEFLALLSQRSWEANREKQDRCNRRVTKPGEASRQIFHNIFLPINSRRGLAKPFTAAFIAQALVCASCTSY